MQIMRQNALPIFYERNGINFCEVDSVAPKFFQNSRAKLIILTNFLAGKLLRHTDLIDFWHHQQTGHYRNKFLI